MRARDLLRIGKIALTLAPDALLSLPVCAALGNLRPLAAALSRGFARLGPAFVKLGQFLSVRPDLVGEPFASEMAKLRDRAMPLEYSVVSGIVRSELGLTPEALFAEFDREPLASASVSQVHRALTFSGERLAIKVQRPDAPERLRQDLSILRSLAALAGRLPTVRPHGDPAGFVDRIIESSLEETDFRREGEACERFRVLFRREARLKVPKVHWGYTTRRVLATEFMEGWKISDQEARTVAGYEELAEVGAQLFFRQVLEYGLFHADLHPSNVFVTADGKIGYLDFGIRGELTTAERENLLGAIIGMLARDERAVLENLAALGVAVPPGKRAGFVAEMRNVLESSFGPSLAETSTAALGRGLMAAVGRHGVKLPHKYALLVKALLTVEGSARTLHSTFDMETAARNYLTGHHAGTLRPSLLADALWRFVLLGEALDLRQRQDEAQPLYSAVSGVPASLNPFSRIRHESHLPQGLPSGEGS